MKNTVIRASAAAMMLLLAGQPVAAENWHKRKMRESVQIGDHIAFSTQEKVVGSTSLIRDFNNNIVTANVTNNDLEPGWAYSMWWVVFNRPWHCAVRWECASSDLEINGGDPRVRASVFYAGGFLSDGNGDASTTIVLVPGKTRRELFAMSKPFGLRRLREAEIHLVIRSHGIAGMWGDVSTQIGTANEACPPDGCANEFFSIHRSR